MATHADALLTDLYQLTMLQAYVEREMHDTAVFELFVRKLPAARSFLLAAGLEQALAFLEALAFGEEEIAWIERQGGFSARFLDYLRGFRFGGDVHAMPEGTAFFANEPILRVTAPLPQAQLVESRLLNLVHFQTMIASKAARAVLAAPGRLLVDFGMRRAHGAEAALLAARASYVAGFSGTATALAGLRYGIPAFGTMAHSFVQAHASEREAFLAFARSRPGNVVLLIDTYDTVAAAATVVDVARTLAAEGIVVRGVRIDSGDLAEDSRRVRAVLDRGGLADAIVFASGNLDERSVAALVHGGAPVAAFGIGTALDTSSDAPYLDAVYKLQEYAGAPRRKRSAGKATWPGRKQVYRHLDASGRAAFDRVCLETEADRGAPLLEPVMNAGRRCREAPGLADVRARAARELATLPDSLRSLDATGVVYPVRISDGIRALARSVDRGTR